MWEPLHLQNVEVSPGTCLTFGEPQHLEAAQRVSLPDLPTQVNHLTCRIDEIEDILGLRCRSCTTCSSHVRGGQMAGAEGALEHSRGIADQSGRET